MVGVLVIGSGVSWQMDVYILVLLDSVVYVILVAKR